VGLSLLANETLIEVNLPHIHLFLLKLSTQDGKWDSGRSVWAFIGEATRGEGVSFFPPMPLA